MPYSNGNTNGTNGTNGDLNGHNNGVVSVLIFLAFHLFANWNANIRSKKACNFCCKYFPAKTVKIIMKEKTWVKNETWKLTLNRSKMTKIKGKYKVKLIFFQCKIFLLILHIPPWDTFHFMSRRYFLKECVFEVKLKEEKNVCCIPFFRGK